VEFGFATDRWLAADPVDPGTRRVMTDGCSVLLDRTGAVGYLLARLGRLESLESKEGRGSPRR